MADIDVYLAEHLTGRLTKMADKHIFSYQINAPEALSLTMPALNPAHIPSASLFPPSFSNRHYITFSN